MFVFLPILRFFFFISSDWFVREQIWVKFNQIITTDSEKIEILYLSLIAGTLDVSDMILKTTYPDMTKIGQLR